MVYSILFSVVLAAAPTESQYEWKQITSDAGFMPRDGAGVVVLNGRGFMLGGWNPGKLGSHDPTTNDVWSFDGDNSWVQLSNAPWEARHCAGYVPFQRRMWVLGGDALKKHYQVDAWSSEDGVNWRAEAQLPWGHRVGAVVGTLGRKLIALGGQSRPSDVESFVTEGAPEDRFYADVWATEDGRNWQRLVEEAPWAGRGWIQGLPEFQGYVWLVGGGTYETRGHPGPRTYFDDVWRSKDGAKWERVIEHAPWQKREFHNVVAWDGKLWVVGGGYSGRNLADVWWSKDGKEWVEVESEASPGPRHAAAVFALKSSLYLAGGNCALGSGLCSDVWVLRKRP